MESKIINIRLKIKLKDNEILEILSKAFGELIESVNLHPDELDNKKEVCKRCKSDNLETYNNKLFCDDCHQEQ